MLFNNYNESLEEEDTNGLDTLEEGNEEVVDGEEEEGNDGADAGDDDDEDNI